MLQIVLKFAVCDASNCTENWALRDASNNIDPWLFVKFQIFLIFGQFFGASNFTEIWAVCGASNGINPWQFVKLQIVLIIGQFVMFELYWTLGSL
jgi:hypothetical protein